MAAVWTVQRLGQGMSFDYQARSGEAAASAARRRHQGAQRVARANAGQRLEGPNFVIETALGVPPQRREEVPVVPHVQDDLPAQQGVFKIAGEYFGALRDQGAPPRGPRGRAIHLVAGGDFGCDWHGCRAARVL